jgi:CRP-like cAMP-binding protein
MNIKAFIELFPIFSSANPKTLESLISRAMENEYGQDKTIILEDSWGNAIYFIVSGWIKVRRLLADSSMTLAILGKGDFFGEMALLDESPRSTDVVSLTNVRLLSIPASDFLEALFDDSKLQHKILQIMATRIRYVNVRFQIRNHPPAIKLVRLLVSLGESYGHRNGQIIEIFKIPEQDLADVADISFEETQKIMEKLAKNEWIDIDKSSATIRLINFKQLVNLANKI